MYPDPNAPCVCDRLVNGLCHLDEGEANIRCEPLAVGKLVDGLSQLGDLWTTKGEVQAMSFASICDDNNEQEGPRKLKRAQQAGLPYATTETLKLPWHPCMERVSADLYALHFDGHGELVARAARQENVDVTRPLGVRNDAGCRNTERCQGTRRELQVATQRATDGGIAEQPATQFCLGDVGDGSKLHGPSVVHAALREQLYTARSGQPRQAAFEYR